MRRTHPHPRFLSLGLVSLTAVLASAAMTACGGDDDESVADAPASSVPDPSAPPADTPAPTNPPQTTDAPGTTAPPGTDATPPAGAIEHPTGADEMVISIGYEGGFVPVGTDFVGAPTLLVAGDGTAIVSGPQLAIYPGPLLPNLQQNSLDEATIQELLAEAAELGLLADVEYARNDMIADAPDTVVRIDAGGETFEHRANALGLEAEQDEARANLQQFVDTASAAAAAAGPTTSYESDAFLIQAQPMTVAELGGDVEPTIATWPADASVRLADAAECAEVPWDEVAALFLQANQLTLFDDAGTTYQVAAVQQLPGRSC